MFNTQALDRKVRCFRVVPRSARHRLTRSGDGVVPPALVTPVFFVAFV